MESVNSFTGGMNKDLSKLILQNNSYVDARNMRLLTEKGQSSMTLENIRGNLFNYKVPDTFPVYKIQVVNLGAPINSTITVNGLVGSSISVTSSTTGQNLYDSIKGLSGFGSSFNVAIGNNYIVIYSQLIDTLPTVSSTLALNVITLVISQTNLIPIGYTPLRDDTYLYTTSNQTINPGGHDPLLAPNASSAGQIWKITYDKITLIPTLTLIYNGILDFTSYHGIPLTATQGRYESLSIKRVYWTDNFNKLRSLNVADPNAFALDPSILNVVPTTTFGIPILQRVSGGGKLNAGVYQVCYQLSNVAGAITNFSELSNPVFTVIGDETNTTNGQGWIGYIGASQGVNTGKQIEWRIDGLDTNFSRIQIIVLERDSLGQTPTITQVFDEPIPANGSFDFTYTGNEPPIPLDLATFLAVNGGFTHCKTISTDFNRLIVANVRNIKSDIAYDARAYRFPISNTSFSIIENGVTNSYSNLTWFNIADTSDAINISTANDPANNTQRYRLNSTILGGEGPNISYEFGTIANKGDDTINLTTATPSPFRHTNQNFNTGAFTFNVLESDDATPQIYPTNNINDSPKFAYYSSAMKGYAREETYRFGIQFFDKQKNPYFVKWIGDIQFPKQFDPNPNAFFDDGTASSNNDFRTSFVDANGTCWVNQVFIKFNIKIPAYLRSQVGGYAIVRVKRTINDKTVMGMGIMNPVSLVNSRAALVYPVTDHALNTDGAVSNIRTFFNCADWMHDPKTYPSFIGSDRLQMVSTAAINANQTNVYTCPVGSCSQNYYMPKLYDCAIPTVAYNSILSASSPLAFNGSLADPTYTTVFNFDYTNTGTSVSFGSACHYLSMLSNMNWVGNGINASTYIKPIALYRRTLSGQYGGNTYSERAGNEYQSCGVFRPILNSTPSSPADLHDSIKVFGGDVFTDVWDVQRAIKNQGSFNRPVAATKESTTFFVALESSVNTGLRQGTSINYNLTVDANVGAGGGDDYTYNTIYSAENTIKTYLPKPAIFILTEEFDNRFWGSNVKINNELSDSWSVFPPNQFYDVEGSYGPINWIDYFKGQMLFFQDRAFGRMDISPRALVPTAVGEVTLGIGAVFYRHDYYSTTVGGKHQWGACKSSDAYYWYDILNRGIQRFSPGAPQNEISDLKGMFSWFNNRALGNIELYDRPTYVDPNQAGIRTGVVMVFDHRYNTLLTTIHSGNSESSPPFTVSFNEQMGVFESFFDFTPYMYITDNVYLWTPNPQSGLESNVYIHDKGVYCNFYGVQYSNTVQLISNPNAQHTKVYDNLQWITEVLDETNPKDPINQNKITWDQIRVSDDYQNSDFQTLIPRVGYNNPPNNNIFRAERSWNYQIPRNRVNYTTASGTDIFNPANLTSPLDKVFGERFRDKYLTIDFSYSNPTNYKFIFDLLKTHYRESKR